MVSLVTMQFDKVVYSFFLTRERKQHCPIKRCQPHIMLTFFNCHIFLKMEKLLILIYMTYIESIYYILYPSNIVYHITLYYVQILNHIISKNITFQNILT